MNSLIITGALIASLSGPQNLQAAAGENLKGANSTKIEFNSTTEKASIEKVIFAYQDALNASDATKVLSYYTKDGVLMANAAPTAEGAEQVKGTYEYVFANSTMISNLQYLKSRCMETLHLHDRLLKDRLKLRLVEKLYLMKTGNYSYLKKKMGSGK